MIEIQNTDSLFYLSQNEHEAVVVTTNGVIRKNGDAVLGKGQALEAKKLVPGLEHQFTTVVMIHPAFSAALAAKGIAA